MATQKRAVRFQFGIVTGSSLAMILSFAVNHSVVWAILHGLLSWLYVLYYCIVY